MDKPNITVYGTRWCGDCRRSTRLLDEKQVRYRWVDVDRDPDAQAYVRRVNDGRRIVPTIVFGDGSVLVEPSDAELGRKLGA